MKTYSAKPTEVERKWYVVDAADLTLGRMATRIARILQGKHKPEYTPFLLCGDYVVVVNAGSVKVTGKKQVAKVYDKYSGYPSGRKEISFKRLKEKNPCKIVELAVRDMLPKSKLAKRMMSSLKIYADEHHPHEAQKLKKLEL